MNRISSRFFAGILLSVALGGTAFAQGTMEQQNACRGDVFRLCMSEIPDVGRIVACLRGNESRLSDSCHEVMFEQQQPAPANGQYTPAPARVRAGWTR